MIFICDLTLYMHDLKLFHVKFKIPIELHFTGKN